MVLVVLQHTVCIVQPVGLQREPQPTATTRPPATAIHHPAQRCTASADWTPALRRTDSSPRPPGPPCSSCPPRLLLLTPPPPLALLCDSSTALLCAAHSPYPTSSSSSVTPQTLEPVPVPVPACLSVLSLLNTVPVPDKPKRSSAHAVFSSPSRDFLTSAVTTPSAQSQQRFNPRRLFQRAASSACRDPASVPTDFDFFSWSCALAGYSSSSLREHSTARARTTVLHSAAEPESPFDPWIEIPLAHLP